MKKNKAIIFYMLGVITFIGGLLITQPIARAALLVFAAIVAGYQVIAEGIMATIQATRKRHRFSPNIHLLMALAALGAIAIGSFEEAAMLILILLARTFWRSTLKTRAAKKLRHYWLWRLKKRGAIPTPVH